MPAAVDLVNPVVPLQGYPAPGYGALDLRRAMNALGREGVVGLTDFQVTPTAGGNTLAVDVNPGQALVQGDTVAYQGLYYVERDTAISGGARLDVAQANASNPRIDAIDIQIYDTVYDGSGDSLARVLYQQGTPTATATLANPLGAPTLPASALRLALIQVSTSTTTISTANLLDVRPYVRPSIQFERTFVFPDSDYVSSSSASSLALSSYNNGLQYMSVRPGSLVYLNRVRMRHNGTGAQPWTLLKRGASVATSNGTTIPHNTGTTVSEYVFPTSPVSTRQILDNDTLELRLGTYTAGTFNQTYTVVFDLFL